MRRSMSWKRRSGLVYRCTQFGFLQLGVLRLGFLKDGDVGVGDLPEGEKILIGAAGLGSLAYRRVGLCQSNGMVDFSFLRA